MPAGSVRRGVARVVWWFVIELIVVFVGVYAAFVLDDHRERRRVAIKKAQVRAALLERFASDKRFLDTIGTFLEDFAKKFATEHEAGSMPRPGPIHLVLGVCRGLWDARWTG